MKENSQTPGFTPQRIKKENNTKLKVSIKKDKEMIRSEKKRNRDYKNNRNSVSYLRVGLFTNL